jgi:hypothetical protein
MLAHDAETSRRLALSRKREGSNTTIFWPSTLPNPKAGTSMMSAAPAITNIRVRRQAAQFKRSRSDTRSAARVRVRHLCDNDGSRSILLGFSVCATLLAPPMQHWHTSERPSTSSYDRIPTKPTDAAEVFIHRDGIDEQHTLAVSDLANGRERHLPSVRSERFLYRRQADTERVQ